MSLRWRFVGGATAVAFVAAAGASSAVWFSFGAEQTRQLDTALRTKARAEVQRFSIAATGDDNGADLHSGVHVRYAVVYDADGHPLKSVPDAESARPRFAIVRRPFDEPFDTWWNNEHLRSVMLPMGAHAEESLWVAVPRTELDHGAAQLARGMVAAVFVAAGASAAAAAWLARILTRDHDCIAGAARAVAAGDLSARVGRVSSDPEMERLALDVDEMIARLGVVLGTQQRFIANASHELRSPIASLLGELSFALRRNRDADAYRRAIEDSLEAARSLKVLAEDLLAMARIGSLDIERQTVALQSVACAAIESARPAAERGGVTLAAACDSIAVEGHRGDLERLVRNLLDNAVRHSPRGGRVFVEAQQTADEVLVIVTDEGPGVPTEARERIFEPFFRLPQDRADASGTGLGLAIGRGVARAHGGDLFVEESLPGSPGARFVVRLPASPLGMRV